MALTYDERLELLKKAREAKKAKREAKLTPEPPASEPEPEPEPVKFTKPKAIKIKKSEPPKYIKDDAKLTKEEYLINDPEPEPEHEPEPESKPEPVVIPAKPVKVSKPRKIKEPVNTLDLTEPEPIETVMQEIVNNDNKYKNPNLQSKIAKAPFKQPEVVITKTIKPIHFLFDY